MLMKDDCQCAVNISMKRIPKVKNEHVLTEHDEPCAS